MVGGNGGPESNAVPAAEAVVPPRMESKTSVCRRRIIAREVEGRDGSMAAAPMDSDVFSTKHVQDHSVAHAK